MPLIKVGSKVPSFSLPDQNGSVLTSSHLAGHPYVLYFYPKDDTSSCTAEACSFSDSIKMFERVGAKVIGVSPDGVKSHGKFATKYKLNITLLADEPVGDKPPAVCEAFGVWGEKSMYGKKYMGVIRTTYLVDAAGVVTHRWDAVKVPGHAEEVLAALSDGSAAATANTAPKKAVKQKDQEPAKKSLAKKTGAKRANSTKAIAKKKKSSKTAAKRKSTR